MVLLVVVSEPMVSVENVKNVPILQVINLPNCHRVLNTHEVGRTLLCGASH